MAKDGKTSKSEYDAFRKTMGTKETMDACPSRKYQVTEAVKVFSGNSAGSKMLGSLNSPSIVQLAVDYKFESMGRAYFKFVKKYTAESIKENAAWINPDFGLKCVE